MFANSVILFRSLPVLSSSCAAEKKQHAAVLWNEQRLLCCRSKTRHTIAPHCITQKHLTIYCRQLQEIIASVTVHRVPKKLSMHDDADPFVRTTRVGRYQKKHSPTHTHPDNQKSFINFLQLLRSTASSLFSLHAWQSFSTTYFQVLFGLEPSISHSMHFFTQSPSSFRNTWTT